MFTVKEKRSVQKSVQKMPRKVQSLYRALLLDLEESGPLQPSWRNFSKLGDGKYHCHLNYHWVACWTYQDEILTVEVYYVGSREKAPY
jgi:mRNA-degrading endonuclease RelE of RelBE toxin-antitoxin system